MNENMHLPIILGRSFLVTTWILIDVQESKLTFKVNGETLSFNFNDNTNLELWYEKTFKAKKVHVIQELSKEGYHIKTFHSHTYNMSNMKNKGKEILNSKVQVDKGKKSSRLWDCKNVFQEILIYIVIILTISCLMMRMIWR